MAIKNTVTETSGSERRMDFAGGYYLHTIRTDVTMREDGWHSDLVSPEGGRMHVAFDMDVCFNPNSVVTGLERRIAWMEKYLADLKTALRVITEG